jgi:hypothetical protein
VPLEMGAAAPVHGAWRAAGRRGPARRRPRARRGMHCGCMLSTTSGIQYVLSARARRRRGAATRARARGGRPPRAVYIYRAFAAVHSCIV